jgi:sugar phosphate isomerase/epimerase
MEGWHPDGYPANRAYSPGLWEWLAGLGLYLNDDPSHLVWLGIDPVAALAGHLDRVLHVQAKDVEIDEAARNRYGVLGRAVDRSPWVSGWWRYRVPGRGVVDWRRVVDTLQQGGYDGVVSVEHEDPVWSGDPERVRQGLVIAERTLGPLVDV